MILLFWKNKTPPEPKKLIYARKIQSPMKNNSEMRVKVV